MKRLLVFALLLSPIAWAAPQPEQLKSTPAGNTLGLHLNEYNLSWKAAGQTGYQILIASDEKILAVNVGDLWDSGRREGSVSERILARGTALQDGSTAWWKVRVWNAGGKVSEWSAAAKVEVPKTTDPPSNRIALLGGTLVSRMDKYGFFEAAVTVRWPHHDIGFRNLGWPADDVFGTARSEFGSAHNTRSWQPPKGERGFGFEKLKKQLGEAKPSTIIVGYGAEAAFADTEEKMKQFQAGYRALLKELQETDAHLVLLTPPLQARHGKVLVDPTAANKRLEQAAAFIVQQANSIKAPFVPLHLLNSFADGIDADINSHFENGVQLNERGYRRLARTLATNLGVYFPFADFADSALPPMAGVGLEENHEETKRGKRYDFTRDQLPPPVELAQLAFPGQIGERVWVNGEEVVLDSVGLIRTGADVEQVEQLRQVILEKNKMHRYKLNPINKAYIFLFRRHEMGHLAYELEDFEDFVRGREQAIAKLRVPRTHRYEVVPKQEWKAPRNYPDHEVPKNIPAPNVIEELKAFKVAEGMEVNLFAKNPMIFNPINLNWDRHGRAWVATSSTYPHIKPGNIPNDRIVILEDTDHDGVADNHKVFAEGLTVPHSVIPVEGGAYVCSTTELIFLTDADGDDVSESRRVVYSGFGNADVHHMIHGLRWAPWGDLFFTQSIYINSFVDTPHGPRRLNGSGVWRFRPETEYLDIFSRGRVNPWGHALDYWGRSFGTDGAGGQGPHDLFPGSAFGTAVGAPRVLRGLVPGPKNTAAEFMTGRHVPTHWRGSILGNDFRANRTVRYELKEKGSGFTGAEVETVLHSSHRSFRPVDIKMGPDGAVYVVDWYNPIIDHGEVDFHHPLRDKSHGRIWRITAKGRPLVERPRIADASISELLDHLKKPEQYARTQANRELVRREVSAEAIEKWVAGLDREASDYDHHLLEAVWLLTARNLPVPGSLDQVYTSEDHRIRAAATRNAGRSSSGMARLEAAVEDEHPRVRLEAVSALRGLGSSEAASVAMRALDHDIDTNLDFALEMTVRDTRDQWLPAMQAGKKVFDGDPSRLSFALKKVNDPRAIGALAEVIQKGELKGQDRANAVTTVAALGSAEQVTQVLAQVAKVPELLEAIAIGARSNAAAPAEKGTVLGYLSSENAKVRMSAAELVGLWKVEGGTEALAKGTVAAKSTAERMAMTRALSRLGGARALTDLWLSQNSPAVRAAAIAAHASLKPTSAAGPAVTILGKVEDSADARIIFEGFLGRQDGPDHLAKALNGKKLPKAIAQEGSRVVRASGRDVPTLIAALNSAGGLKPLALTLTAAERKSLLADAASNGSVERGKQLYHRAALACATCHLIDGKGGKLGPDLSTVGSYMTPESLLESVLNPSTDIKQGYETVVVTRKDQTLVSGLLQRKTDSGVLVRDPTGKVVNIPGKDIAKVDTSPVSLMPPGLTASLTRDEMVDLMTFLTKLGKK